MAMVDGTNAVQELLAELTRLRAERDRLREALAWYMETGACACEDDRPCGHCRAKAAQKGASDE